MDLARVVAVGGAGSVGSGYLVAPRLVLTSAHVVGDIGTVSGVFRPGRGGHGSATVVWRGTPGGRDDAALAFIADEEWEPPPGPVVRWGRTVTHRPGIACAACGVPNLVQRPGRPLEMLQPSGRLNPGDRLVGDRYVITLDGHPPAPRPDGRSPWGGLSGAALFCGDLLTGVIVEDPAGRAHAHLEAVPAYVLHHDPAFRSVLAEHSGGTEPVLEPVELSDLADTSDLAPPGGALSSPAALLRARRAVVPFRRREELLLEMSTWASGSGVGAVLLHGLGGQGKTRLADRFTGVLREQGWSTLWLSERAAGNELTTIGDVTTPLLIVVDYADSRAQQLDALMAVLARRRGHAAVRLLLLARTAGRWWRTAREASPEAELLLAGASTVELPPLEPSLEGRAEAYGEAVEAFAVALPRVHGQESVSWKRIAAGLSDRRIDGPEEGVALHVHMAALADLLDAADPPDPPTSVDPEQGADGVEDRLLAHERRYWRRAATARGLDRIVTPETLDDAMATTMLVGADDHEHADAVWKQVPGLADRARCHRDDVTGWVASLYPPLDSGSFDSLRPDRLAERFVGRHLAERPHLVDELLPAVTAAQVERLLTVYSRAAAHRVFNHALDQGLTQFCVRHTAAVATTTVTVALQVEAAEPLIQALHRMTEILWDDPRRLGNMVNLVSRGSDRLAAWALEVSRRLVEIERPSSRDSDPSVQLATTLNNLSSWANLLGHSEEAITAGAEAVAAWRSLAHRYPDLYRHRLAGSLSQHAQHLRDSAATDEALTVNTEAIAIYRDIAHAQPSVYLPRFAQSLSVHSHLLNSAGRTDEALAASAEAVGVQRELATHGAIGLPPDEDKRTRKIADQFAAYGALDAAAEFTDTMLGHYRNLAEAEAEDFQPALAAVLHTHARHLNTAGHTAQALEAMSEAVDLYRSAARRHPDAFRLALIHGLDEFAGYLLVVEDWTAALARCEEAVELCDRVTGHAIGSKNLLPHCLHLRSTALRELGRLTEAVACGTEAVRRYREAPHTSSTNLAEALHDLAVSLVAAGRNDQAIAPMAEGLELYRDAMNSRSATLDRFATMLRNNIRLSERLGQGVELLALRTDAIAVHRRLLSTDPHRYGELLRDLLHAHGSQLSDLGRYAEALEAYTEAVNLDREGVETEQPDLAVTVAINLNNQAAALSNLGRHEDALVAIRSAIDTYRQVVRTNTDYLGNLGVSLVNNAGVANAAGRPDEALAALQEAIATFRPLARTQPRQFLPELAQALHSYALQLGQRDAQSAALAALDEAVSIRRGLVTARQRDGLVQLADSLLLRTVLLGMSEQLEEARASVTEAVEHYRGAARSIGHGQPPGLAQAEEMLARLSV